MISHTYVFFAVLALGVGDSLSSLETITELDTFPPFFVRGVKGALSYGIRKKTEIDRISHVPFFTVIRNESRRLSTSPRSGSITLVA